MLSRKLACQLCGGGGNVINTHKQTNKGYRDTKGDKQYLSLLYLGSNDLSSLLYDVNQQVALLKQLVFLPRCVYLDRTEA